MSRDPKELLAAYVDGVGELTADERHRVEQLLHDDPAMRADEGATRELLDRLRDLPPLGTEPSWTALEQAISREVGPSVPRVPWWRRNLKWIESSLALGATAAIAVLWLSHGDVEPSRSWTPPTVKPMEPPDTVALWGYDEAFEVPEADALRLLDEFDDEIQQLATEDDGSPDSVLPASDLEWVDGLDDKALERAEHWLERENKG